MPKEPHRYYDRNETEDEYRRRQAAKAKRRKKRQAQRLLVIGAFILAAILLLVVLILIFNAIFGAEKPPASASSSSSFAVSPPLEPVYTHPVAVDAGVWNLKCVNGNNPLPDNFAMLEGAEDGQLGSIVQNGVKYYFDNRMVEPLSRMITDCNAQVAGGSLAIYSGYRGWPKQTELWQAAYQRLLDAGNTPEMAAILAEAEEPSPGKSEHQIGLAADFVTGTVQAPSINFSQTPEFQWLTDNAAAYGFILRYPSEKELITGVTVKPCHFRYVGVDDARAIAGAAICLEEYLLQIPDEEPALAAGQSAP
jgi:LAS superfamily LD-carboxypeptidase LdcB